VIAHLLNTPSSLVLQARGEDKGGGAWGGQGTQHTGTDTREKAHGQDKERKLALQYWISLPPVQHKASEVAWGERGARRASLAREAPFFAYSQPGSATLYLVQNDTYSATNKEGGN
jgi:hypothetical protein